MTRAARAVSTLALLAALCAPVLSGGPRFVDATPESGIDYVNLCGDPPGKKGWINESMGAGAAWLDYDGDGNLDLYVANGSDFDRKPGTGEPNRLYRGDGKGRFSDVTEKSGAGDRGWGYGIAAGDIDNDGDTDLFIANLGENTLLVNRGDGTFENATKSSGLGGTNDWSTSTAWFDMEGDGDLDLYVGNYMIWDTTKVPRRGSAAADTVNCKFRAVPVYCGPLGQVPVQDRMYRNDGTGRFSDVTAEVGMRLNVPRFSLGVVVADYDNDGDQDVYVANDSVPNSLWRNMGQGKFLDVGVGTLSALNADGRSQAGMGTDFGDYSGDGWLDLVVTNFSQDLNTIYRNLEGRFFIDDSMLAGMGVTQLSLSWGAGFRDFDRDGDLDLFIANGHIYPQVDGHDLGTAFRQHNHMFVNTGGRFVESSGSAGPGMAIKRSFRGAAFGDYDNDGDVDVFVTALDEPGLLLRNETREAGHFLQIRLEGTDSNHDGIGTRVIVRAGEQTFVRERKGGGSYLSGSDPRLHFGLGPATRVDRIEVRWPSGSRATLRDIGVDRLITVREGHGLVR